MPLQGVPPHVVNLRQILLSRIGISVKEEDDEISFLQARIREKVPDYFRLPESSSGLTPVLHDMAGSSIRVKFAVANWIRQNLGAHFKPQYPKQEMELKDVGPHQFTECDSRAKTMTLDHFQTISKALEELGDFAILADVLDIISNSEDDLILASVCDTVSYHLNVFAAIGAHTRLFDNLHQRYEYIRHTKTLDLWLVESLIDLGRTIPNTTQKVQGLIQHAHQYRRSSSAIACSPISDTMAEALQFTEPNSAEDIEQVLGSGISMDKHMLDRLFTTIVKRLEASWTSLAPSVSTFCELLIRLRRFGRKDVDGFICGWVVQFLRSPARPELGKVLLPLICSGCLTLRKLLELAASALDEPIPTTLRAVLAIEVLEMLASISSGKTLATTQVSKPISQRLPLC